MIFVWTGYKMKFRCFVPGCDNTTTAAYLYNSSHTVFTIPTTTPGESHDQCQRYADSESLTNGHCTPERFSRNSTVPCAEYVYDPSIMLDSVMSQFNLVCDRGWLLTLVNTIYMVGMLVGSFCIGAFSDKFGRKKAMLLSFLMIGVSGAATPFAPNLATLIILRFFTGVGSVGNFMSLFVLALELVSTRVRTWCGLVIEIPFSTGISLIGVVAIFVNRWQQLQFMMLAPALIFLVYALFIPESPRWLMSAGRVAEGELVLDRMAKYNRTEHPQESASTFSLTAESMEKPAPGNQPESPEPVAPSTSRLGPLFSTRTLCIRIFIMAYQWMVVSMVFYGLGMNAANLNGNVYANFILVNLTDLPSILVTILAMDVVGRRLCCLISFTLAGLGCIAAGICANAGYHMTTVAMTMVGKFGAAAAFNIVFVYGAELFPTVVRNTGIGLTSASARVGSIIAPIVSTLGVDNQLAVSLILGVPALLAAALNLLLPETCGAHLPQTIEQAENIGCDLKWYDIPFFVKRRQKKFSGKEVPI